MKSEKLKMNNRRSGTSFRDFSLLSAWILQAGISDSVPGNDIKSNGAS